MDRWRECDIISEISKGRLRWLGHVERMSEENNSKERVLKKKVIEEKRAVLMPRRSDDTENDVKKIGV